MYYYDYKSSKNLKSWHFLQILSTTTGGKRYIDFYNVANYPYLAIIDPRTGECMRSFNHITVDSLATGLNDMLSMHASPDNTPSDLVSTGDVKERSSLPKKRQARTDSIVDVSFHWYFQKKKWISDEFSIKTNRCLIEDFPMKHWPNICQ